MKKLLLAIVLTASAPAAAQTTADFKGQTISINVGYPVGGAPDLYFRVLARHYGRHIPGNPTVIAKNMPGAGTMRAANYVYNIAAKDGTELANFSSSAMVEPLMDNDQARFDANKFSWVGSMNQEINFCGIWQRPGAPTSFAEMLKQETVWASSGGLTSFGYQHPLIFKNVLGASIRMVSGYPGMTQAFVALQRGEAQGLCGLVRTHIRTLWPKEVEEGRFRLIVQLGPKTTNELGDHVADIFDFAKTEEDRKVFEFHFHTKLLGRPLAGPPGVPIERLAILRKAFQDTLRDPEFLAEAKKANLDIDPATHEQVQQLLAQFAAYPKSVIEKAKAAITR